MADLDDFFAKKDRKKSKSKKFSTTEEVAKKLDDNAKKPEKPIKKDRNGEKDDGSAQDIDEDEWREFEEEKKDYSGLKIGHLTIDPDAEGNGSQDTNIESLQPTYDEAGNEIEKKSGPWKRIEEPKEDKKPVVETTTPATPSKSTYVPPSLLRLQQQQRQEPQQQPLQPMRLRSKIAPDVTNEELFPTLGNAPIKPQEPKRGRNETPFETVPSRGSVSQRYMMDQQQQQRDEKTKISTGNRFNTLSNDS